MTGALVARKMYPSRVSCFPGKVKGDTEQASSQNREAGFDPILLITVT